MVLDDERRQRGLGGFKAIKVGWSPGEDGFKV